MSVATFHWIPDNGALFKRCSSALPSGGRLEAEFGGAGNLTQFLAAVRRAGGPPDDDSALFASADQTERALEAAGFVDIDVREVQDPVLLERGDQLEAFIATVLLGAILHAMTSEDGRALIHRIAAQMPEPVIDYARVQLTAVRA